MTEEEAKDAKHQQYVEDEKRRRSRIKTAGKWVFATLLTLGGYILGKKSQGGKA